MSLSCSNCQLLRHQVYHDFPRTAESDKLGLPVRLGGVFNHALRVRTNRSSDILVGMPLFRLHIHCSGVFAFLFCRKRRSTLFSDPLLREETQLYAANACVVHCKHVAMCAFLFIFVAILSANLPYLP